MWDIQSQELANISLNCKPGSLELLVAGAADDPVLSDGRWVSAGVPYCVKSVASFTFLGGHINRTADPVAMCDFRVAQAWLHFWARRGLFCNRVVPLRLRWARLQETVLRTCFYLVGVFGWHPVCTRNIASMFHKMLCFTLCRGRGAAESDGDYHHRMNSKLKDLCRNFGMPTIEAQITRLHAGWVGHCVRQGAWSQVSRALTWRDEIWWETVKNDANRPKYKFRGKPLTQSTAIFYDILGPFWHVLSMNRKQWRMAAASLKHLPAASAEVFFPGGADGECHASLRPVRFPEQISIKL